MEPICQRSFTCVPTLWQTINKTNLRAVWLMAYRIGRTMCSKSPVKQYVFTGYKAQINIKVKKLYGGMINAKRTIAYDCLLLAYDCVLLVMIAFRCERCADNIFCDKRNVNYIRAGNNLCLNST